MKTHTPAEIHPPFARYAHVAEAPAGYRLIAVSGQLGIGPDGAVPEGAEAQAALCFRNIDACLRAAGAGPGAILRLNAYVTDRAHLAGYMAARDRYCATLDAPPASTLMIVSGFAREAFVVEVEALAAAP